MAESIVRRLRRVEFIITNELLNATMYLDFERVVIDDVANTEEAVSTRRFSLSVDTPTTDLPGTAKERQIVARAIAGIKQVTTVRPEPFS